MPICQHVYLTNKEKWPTIVCRVVIHFAVYCTKYMVKIAMLLLDVSDDMINNFCVFHLDRFCYLLPKTPLQM